jgi:protein-S-isoprenylcysteine O-methyltransferase Ste14
MFILWLLAASVIGSVWQDNIWVGPVFAPVGCVIMGCGVIGRIWCLVCIAGFKNEELITDGPYSLCRNPLYFFSILGTIGAGLGSGTVSFPLLAVLGFAVWYPSVIRFESRNLAERHGLAYDAYSSKTPLLIPSWRGFHESPEHTVRSSSFRRGIFDTLWFFATYALMHAFYAAHEHGVLPVWYRLP